MLKILVILAYFNRPRMVQKCIESVLEQDYDNYQVALIDDSDPEFHYPFEGSELSKDPRWRYYRINDTKEQKLARGSIHGKFMNQAIIDSDSDLVVILCDDDGLYPGYLKNLNEFFTNNPSILYAYSHVCFFNSQVEEFKGMAVREFWLNKLGNINPYCQVDGSQVVWRTLCNKQGQAWYPWPQTNALDAAMFAQLFNKYGLCAFTGFVGQYKNWSPNQLGSRGPAATFDYSD